MRGRTECLVTVMSWGSKVLVRHTRLDYSQRPGNEAVVDGFCWHRHLGRGLVPFPYQLRRHIAWGNGFALIDQDRQHNLAGGTQKGLD